MDNQVHFGERFTAGDELGEEFKLASSAMMKVFAEEPDVGMIDGILNVLRCEHIAAVRCHFDIKVVVLIYNAN